MLLFQDLGREIDIRATGNGVEHSLKISGYSIPDRGSDLLPLSFNEGTVGKVFIFTYEEQNRGSLIVIKEDYPVVTIERLPLRKASFRATFPSTLDFCEVQLVVDGIECGLHWSVLEPTWKEIGSIARQLNVQIFATTHGYECIGAAYKALRGDVFLCRLEKRGDQINAVTYVEETPGIALEEKFEVR